MKKIMLTMLLFLTGTALAPTVFSANKPLLPAETVASNGTTIGFTITLVRISDNLTYNYYMEPDFYNIDSKWQLEPGFYQVTLTPVGTYPRTKFWINGQNIYKDAASNTDSVTFSSVQLYEGGGNQLIINPY